jgi:hypothetical protein
MAGSAWMDLNATHVCALLRTRLVVAYLLPRWTYVEHVPAIGCLAGSHKVVPTFPTHWTNKLVCLLSEFFTLRVNISTCTEYLVIRNIQIYLRERKNKNSAGFELAPSRRNRLRICQQLGHKVLWLAFENLSINSALMP